MAKNPAFPFYANDYLVDTLRWTRGMKSLHVDLMAESWSNKEIKDDNGCPEGLNDEDKNLWLKIRHKWVLQDGIWRNLKLEESRSERQRFLSRQAENGSKGGRPIKSKPTQNPRVSDSLTQTEPARNPLEEEVEKEREEETEQQGVQGENEPDTEDVDRWTEDAITGKDYYFHMMEQADAKKLGEWPPGFDRTYWILHHRGLISRYNWKYNDQQDFRQSLLSELRKNKNTKTNGTQQLHGIDKKQQHTNDLIQAHLREYGTPDSRVTP